MIVDVILTVIILVLIYTTVHYRAQAKAASTTSSSAVATIEAELALLGHDVRSTLDSKFKALGQWLTAEMQKATQVEHNFAMAVGADPNPGASVAVASEPIPEPAPTADSGGTESPTAIVEKMKSSVAAMQERIPRLEAAIAAAKAAEDQLAAELAN